MISIENGSSVARNNRTGGGYLHEDVFSRRGIGHGHQGFRRFFILDTQSALDQFINRGWETSGQTDSTGKLGEKGCSAETAGTIAPGLRLYQLTENGLALQITIQGTKY
jgi:hypothetical protein